MRKILHIADLHLGFEHRYLGERAGRRAEEALLALERIVEWVLNDAHEIGAVLIAGDLFETHDPDPRLLGRVVTTLKKIPAGGRTLVTAPGNHDEYSYPESVYRLHASSWPGLLVTNPNPARVATFKLGEADCAVYSMAYTAGLSARTLTIPEEEVRPGKQGAAYGKGSAREIRIALLHGTLDAEPTDRSFRIDTATLTASGFDYAALGHIHKPSETRIGDGLAVYPGTLNGKGFDDSGVEELVVVSFPGGAPSVERVPFPRRTIQTRQVDLGRYENQEQLIEELQREAGDNMILRLELLGPRPEGFDPEYLLGRLGNHFFHLELNDRSMEISEEEIERLEHQPTVKGLFTQLMCERIAEAAEDPNLSQRTRMALMKGLAAFESVQRGR